VTAVLVPPTPRGPAAFSFEGTAAPERLEAINESRLKLPGGAELPSQAIVTGRGPDLFVIAGRDCYRATLSS